MNVLFIFTPHTGHFNPSIYLVEKILTLGYNITYYVTEDFAPIFKNLNINLKIMPFNDDISTEEFSITHGIGIFRNLFIPLINLLKEDKTKYDIIIVDSFIDGCGIAKAMNIPKVISVYSTQGKIYGKALLDKLVKEKEDLIKKYYADSNRDISLNVNMDGFCIRNCLLNHYSNESDYKLLCSSKYLQKDSDKLEGNYLYIGPYGVKRKDNSKHHFNLDLKKIKSENKKIIYFSLGTLGNFWGGKEFPIKILKALDKIEGIKVIASLKSEERIPEFSDKILIYDYIPQLEILKNCDLCITHGGYNTVNESLFFSVPLIVIPFAADQPLNGELIENLKCGIKINPKDVNEINISESVKKILTEPIYKKQAKVVSKSLKDALDNSEEILKKILK